MGIQIRPFRGKWQVRIRRRGQPEKTKLWDTLEEAEEHVRQRTAEIEAGESWLSDIDTPTVSKALTGWIEAEGHLWSLSHRKSLESRVAQHLTPFFGERPLASLTPEDMKAFQRWMLGRKKSPATAHNCLSDLRRVLSRHVEAGLLAHNVAQGVGKLTAAAERARREEIDEAQAWTRTEVATLLGLAQNREPALYGPLLMALHTGMRRGEVLGLGWEDVGPEIRVRRAWVRGKMTTPKSGKARSVPVSATLRAFLEEHRRSRQSREGLHPADSIVFRAPQGGRWDERNFARAWSRLHVHMVKADVRPLRFHDARHTFASWALHAGRSIKWVQETLGHSSAELTLRTYSHLMPREGGDLDFLESAGTARVNQGTEPATADVSAGARDGN